MFRNLLLLLMLTFSVSTFAQLGDPNRDIVSPSGDVNIDAALDINLLSGNSSVKIPYLPQNAVPYVDDTSGNVSSSPSLTFDGTKFQVDGRLEVNSTSIGSSPCPPMTETDRDAITTPENGDCIYNIDEEAPEFYNTNKGLWEVAAGGGGAGGEGVNVLLNPGFEDGFNSEWTGSGDASNASAGNGVLFGEESLQFDPDAQGDYFESSLATLPEGLYGQACQAEFIYKGGDENLEAQVINANGTVIAQKSFSEFAAPVHDIATRESVFFLCPSESEITGDANKGQLKLRIAQETTTIAASSRWDSMYLGNLKGLVETQLPDTLVATVNPSTGSILSGDWLDSFSCSGGDVTFDYTSLGLSQKPGYDYEDELYSQESNTLNATSTSVTFTLLNANGDTGDCTSTFGTFTLSKQGQDAKQAIQTYRSAPKSSNVENELGASIGSSGTVSNENVDWVDGDCTTTTTANYEEYNCPVVGFEDTPNCQATLNGAFLSRVGYDYSGSTSSNLLFRVRENNGDPIQLPFNTICQKSSDYKSETVQIILTNQVETGFKKGVRDETCFVGAADGTPSSDTDLCSSWVESYIDNSVGFYTINFKNDVITDLSHCQVTVNLNGGVLGTVDNPSASSVDVILTGTGGNNSDRSFHLYCRGER